MTATAEEATRAIHARFKALDDDDLHGAAADEVSLLHKTVSLVADGDDDDGEEEDDGLREQPSELSRLEDTADRLQAQNDELTDQIETLLGIKVRCCFAEMRAELLRASFDGARLHRSAAPRSTPKAGALTCSMRCFLAHPLPLSLPAYVRLRGCEVTVNRSVVWLQGKRAATDPLLLQTRTQQLDVIGAPRPQEKNLPPPWASARARALSTSRGFSISQRPSARRRWLLC